jgi:hypothetical protein
MVINERERERDVGSCPLPCRCSIQCFEQVLVFFRVDAPYRRFGGPYVLHLNRTEWPCSWRHYVPPKRLNIQRPHCRNPKLEQQWPYLILWLSLFFLKSRTNIGQHVDKISSHIYPKNAYVGGSNFIWQFVTSVATVARVGYAQILSWSDVTLCVSGRLSGISTFTFKRWEVLDFWRHYVPLKRPEANLATSHDVTEHLTSQADRCGSHISRLVYTVLT